jgi:hypothetical protein
MLCRIEKLMLNDGQKVEQISILLGNPHANMA